MTKRLHAARCLSPRTASKAVWITDDVLADTFRRFTSVCVRHGSHVPGPLEARRRSAKRKNTNLAHFGAPQLDPAILFSKKPQPGWWNDRQLPTSDPHASALPAWLFKPQKKAHIDPSEWPAVNFEADLACCQSLSDLRSLLRNSGLDSRLSQAQAEQIYEHVANQDWPADQYAQYLTDPVLHPSGGSNHLKFLLNLEEKVSSSRHRRSAKVEDWANILESICKSVKLGLFSAQEWMQAVELSFAIEEAFSARTNHLAPVHWAINPSLSTSALLDSLEQCAVLSLKDLNPLWLEHLSERLLGCDFDSITVKLLWRLRGKENLRLIADFTISWLERHGTVCDAAVCADALLQLPHVPLLQILGHLTGVLTVGVLEGRRDLKVLSAWAQVLQSFNSESLVRLQLTRQDIKHLRSSASGLERSQRGLLLLWTLHQVFRYAPAQFDQLDSFSVIEGGLKQQGSSTAADFQDELLTTLQSLPLPDKDRLLADFPQIARSLNKSVNGIKARTRQAALLRGDFAYLADDATYDSVRWSRPSSLTQAVERVNTDLGRFKRIIQYLIHTNKHAFRIITRIIRHNLAFKAAIVSSWPQRQDWQQRKDASIRASLESQSVPISQRPKLRLDPEQVLDIIHTLAMAFATSPATSNRNALSKVQWCYKFLKQHNAPIQPPMTRALWHAGITRYEKGYPDTHYDHILERVRRVEGPEVAAQLRRSPDFRAWRTACIESVARGEPPPPEGAENLQSDKLAAPAAPLDPKEAKDLEYARALNRRVMQIMEAQEWAGKAATTTAIEAETAADSTENAQAREWALEGSYSIDDDRARVRRD